MKTLSNISRWIPTFEGRRKAVRIPVEAYNKLMQLKYKEIGKAKKKRDLDRLSMLTAMDAGTFTGYLIYSMARAHEEAERMEAEGAEE